MCFTVTLVDGLVLARSAFHHSINYRSVAVLGHARRCATKARSAPPSMRCVEHVVPGRRRATREVPTRGAEATEVVALALEEASAKIRSGGPVDAPEDYALPVWAGEIPLGLRAGSRSPMSGVVPQCRPTYASDCTAEAAVGSGPALCSRPEALRSESDLRGRYARWWNGAVRA